MIREADKVLTSNKQSRHLIDLFGYRAENIIKEIKNMIDYRTGYKMGFFI